MDSQARKFFCLALLKQSRCFLIIWSSRTPPNTVAYTTTSLKNDFYKFSFPLRMLYIDSLSLVSWPGFATEAGKRRAARSSLSPSQFPYEDKKATIPSIPVPRFWCDSSPYFHRAYSLPPFHGFQLPAFHLLTWFLKRKYTNAPKGAIFTRLASHSNLVLGTQFPFSRCVTHTQPCKV
jgi:hypothetical protein